MRDGFQPEFNFSNSTMLTFLAACGAILVIAAAGQPPPQRAAADVESAQAFETYRTQVEPIFLKQRENGIRCYDCHSTMNTRLRLEPLPAGSSVWTEAESRKNFERVAELVLPGDPLKSRLLLHPLATQAGGDSAHGGGKFWKSQSDPEWQILADWVKHLPSIESSTAPNLSANTETGPLDFEAFKNTVQPIFLKERPGHARCYGCHTASNRVFHLATLSPGLSDWTEEQSRQNFKSASQLVSPGQPLQSRLLMHPLAPEAGGDAFHSGGRQFASQEDPDWQTIANWVRAASVGSSPAS